jgi:hypothetical protein
MRFALAAVSVTALAALSGCGSSSSTAPEAAFSIQMEQTDPEECTIADNLGQVGSVSVLDIGTTVLDGMVDSNMNTAAISCTVSGTSTYNVQAQVTDGAYALQITIPSITASATLDSPAMGSISYEAAATADEAFQGMCMYYFVPGSSGMGSAPPVAAGRIWVAFQCPSLQSGMTMCPITQGYAVFEDCLTTQEM